jgi:hypothetical protein
MLLDTLGLSAVVDPMPYDAAWSFAVEVGVLKFLIDRELRDFRASEPMP